MLAKKNKKIKILLTGGGTMGSVSPLLAIVDALEKEKNGIKEKNSIKENIEYLWIGTKTGPEYHAVSQCNIKFIGIDSGKLRRYWSLQNFKDIWNIEKGFFQSLLIMIKARPSIIITAGSFVSVPVVIAGWILRIPIIVHQLDYKPGLANKIMGKFAKIVTCTLVKSVKDYGDKAIWIGSLLRQTILQPINKEQAKHFFGLNNDLPTVLILGGGTGAVAINELIENGLEDLIKYCQIIHLTGHNKFNNIEINNYNTFNFLHNEDMALAIVASDLVVCRAGMGTLTELSYLSKPVILIPMPNSHQELNAKAIQGAKASIVLNEQKLTSSELVNIIQEVIYTKKLLKQMSKNIYKAFKHGGNQKMIQIINKIINR